MNKYIYIFWIILVMVYKHTDDIEEGNYIYTALETFYHSSLWNINGCNTIKTKHSNSESFYVWIYWCFYIYYSSYCTDIYFLQQYEGLNTNSHRVEAPHTVLFKTLKSHTEQFSASYHLKSSRGTLKTACSL